ncbi:hypothetical protein MIDIC_170007 [Alphaproteobacteria bacterium]
MGGEKDVGNSGVGDIASAGGTTGSAITGAVVYWVVNSALCWMLEKMQML